MPLFASLAKDIKNTQKHFNIYKIRETKKKYSSRDSLYYHNGTILRIKHQRTLTPHS